MFDKDIHKTLTKKQAYQYLDIGREQFNAEIKKGNISFLPCGKRIKFTIEALEKWRSNTINHIDYTSEAKPTMRISRISRPVGSVCSFEELREKHFPKKRTSFA